MRRRLFIASLFSAALALGGVVLDRIAVTVGAKDVITESEILDDIRITAFLNGDRPDFSPQARRQAAERLVDQYLVRREMNISHYPEPEASEAAKMLAQIKQQRFHNDDAAYRRALKEYGITEQELQKELLWQVAALRFTDYRFQPETPRPNVETAQHLTHRSQERAARRTGADGAPTPPTGNVTPRTDEAVPPDVDQQLEAWLKQARGQTRIVYHSEAFE